MGNETPCTGFELRYRKFNDDKVVPKYGAPGKVPKKSPGELLFPGPSKIDESL
jgi:hypothetical protein